MEMVKVSFIMMAYNSEAYIEKAIRSVLEQSIPEVNIFIRNNGSTDKTLQIIKKLHDEDSRVFYVSNEVNGVAENGIEQYLKGWWPYDEGKLGEYISIIDSDDWLEKDFVEKLYNEGKKNNADIVLGGSNFYDEKGTIVGQRYFDDHVTDDMHSIGEKFPDLYGNFRTWWGKLFKKEFFLKNYDIAWTPDPIVWHEKPVHWKLDTSIMTSYLSVCKRFVSVSAPLYNFLFHDSSTYQKRKPETRHFSIIDSQYVLTINLLKRFNILSYENIHFMDLVHWGYLKELFPNLIMNEEISLEERLNFLENIAYDDICLDYSKRMFSMMYCDIKEIINHLERKYGENVDFYKSYMTRMSKFSDMIQGESWHPAAVIVILSVLCDRKNYASFGEKLLNINDNCNSVSFKESLEIPGNIRKWFKIHPELWVRQIEKCSLDHCPELFQMKAELNSHIQSGNFDEVVNKAVEILEINPVDFDSLICIVMYYYRNSEINTGNLIKESMSAIWGLDVVEAGLNLQDKLKCNTKWKIKTDRSNI